MKKLSTAAKEKADKIGEAILEVLKATSVQYAMRYKGELIVSASVGKYDTQGSRLLSPNDMYGVGSTSKMFVTAAVMLLADKGQVDIDKPYANYVPAFQMADPRYAEITVRHLMNHASGIYGTHFKGGFLFEDNDTFAHDHLLEALKVCHLKYAPGTFSEYCNDGFQLLEIMVEQLSGMPYNEFLKKYFFQPMGIQNTVTPQDTYDRNQMAKYAMPQVHEGDLPYETTNLIGTGGVVSTAEDLTLFGQILMGKKVLSEKAVQLMGEKEYTKGALWPKDEEPNNLFAYGLGFDHVHVPPFDKVGLQAMCKGGDTMQYHASLVVIPQLDLTAASVSAGGASFANYALVIELLKDACLENGLVQEFPEPAAPVPPVKAEIPAELEQLTGLYADSRKFFDIKFTDGGIDLEAQFDGLIPAQKYIYAGDGQFVSPDGKNAVHFEQTAGGLTFLQGDLVIDLPNIGEIKMKAYLFQKLEKNPLDPKVAAAWQARDKKKYLLVDDMHTSMGLLLTQAGEVEMLVNTEYGYATSGAKILDENHAQSVLYFRDIRDHKLFCRDGVEYLHGAGLDHINTDHIPMLKADQNGVTIPANGYIQYFKVDDATAGKTISVTLPKVGAFAAYEWDAEKSDPPKAPVKLLTTVMDNKPVQLAKGNLLAFAAAPGEAFSVELK